MAQIKVKFFKVTALPSEPAANAFYFVADEEDEFAEMWLTDESGEVKASGNSAMILALMVWGNISNKPATFPPSAHSHTWGIGDTMTNGTEHAIPFFGVSGVWSQNYNRFRFENTANQERFFASGRKADGAFVFEFPGWNGAGYTKGMRIKSTDAAGYVPYHLLIENAAYASVFQIHVGDHRMYFGNEMSESGYVFSGFYGNYTAMTINTGGTTMKTPRVKMQSNSTTDVVAEFRGFAGQTANIWEYRNSAGTLLSALTKEGAVTVPEFADENAAPNSSIYWNLNDNRLQFKDSSGTVINIA